MLTRNGRKTTFHLDRKDRPCRVVGQRNMWKMSTTFFLIVLCTAPCKLVMQAFVSEFAQSQTGYEANAHGEFIRSCFLFGIA